MRLALTDFGYNVHGSIEMVIGEVVLANVFFAGVAVGAGALPRLRRRVVVGRRVEPFAVATLPIIVGPAKPTLSKYSNFRRLISRGLVGP